MCVGDFVCVCEGNVSDSLFFKVIFKESKAERVNAELCETLSTAVSHLGVYIQDTTARIMQI